MLTVLNTEIIQILDQTMAKVTVQFPITDIPTDEASIIKAVKDALCPAKAEQAPPIPTVKDAPTAGAAKQAPAKAAVKGK